VKVALSEGRLLINKCKLLLTSRLKLGNSDLKKFVNVLLS
jgi:hypothetical protein